MSKKRGQTWSIETYIAIAIFLISLIFFYGLTTINRYKSNISLEVDEISRELLQKDIIKDGELSLDDLSYLQGINCTELKDYLNTNKNLCFYFKDSEGNLIDNGTAIIHGFGCPEINVSGLSCGSTS